MSYTFPFSTCETPHKKGIAQPYSALFNGINCAIICYFLLQTKHNYTFVLFFFILCFELFHVFSHSVHLSGSIQTNIIHLLSYAINISLLFFFYNYTTILPSLTFILFCMGLIVLDIYLFFNMNLIYFNMNIS